MIHPTAIVSEKARIGNGVKIGPYSIIGDNVVLYDGVEIGSHCTIGCSGGIRDGEDNEDGLVTVSYNTKILNYVTIKNPSRQDITYIGTNCLVMDYVNVGHDVQIYNHVTIATGCRIAGVSTIKSYSTLSMNTVVRNRVTIGECVMTGAGSVVVKDVDDYWIVMGVPARKTRMNYKGAKKWNLGITV